MRYLLSIHDVWPGNRPLVEDHWSRLKALGARHIALMVVPRYHGRTSIAEDPAFLEWLAAKAADGAEIFLHGYRHLIPEGMDGEARDLGRSAWGRWVNRRLVGGEAEFCGLPPAEGARLLGLATGAFRRAGLEAAGFVAPTWHGAPPSAALLSDGLRIWETRSFLHHLPTGRRLFAPALSWAPPAGSADAALYGGRPWLEILLRLPLLKAVVHPGDLFGHAVLRVLERVAARGRSTSYAEAWSTPN